MPSVFVLEIGEYSDGKIVGVFSTKETADNCASQFGEWRNLRITEWEVDKVDAWIPKGMSAFGVILELLTGNVSNESPKKYDPDAKDEFNEGCFITQCNYRNIWLFETDCFARDWDHAVKIANERLAQWKAEHPEEWEAIIKRCENRNERAERLHKMIAEQDPDWTM